MFDSVVVVDESIVRVGSVVVAVPRLQSRQRTSVGQRFVPHIAVRSVDEVVVKKLSARLNGQLYIIPGEPARSPGCGTVGPGGLV